MMVLDLSPGIPWFHWLFYWFILNKLNNKGVGLTVLSDNFKRFSYEKLVSPIGRGNNLYNLSRKSPKKLFLAK